jgi:DNA polymerase III alpha subunit (gram-positive type)
MIQLQDKDFKNLLSDLYTAFAPQKLDGVDGLVEKYKDSAMSQRNAVQMAFIKYVNSSNPNYLKYSHILPEVGTEKNIMFLMESYARGERMISEDAVLEIQKKTQEQESERLRREAEEKRVREEREAEIRDAEEKEKAEKEAERLRLIKAAKETSEKSNETLNEELEKAKRELKEFQEKTLGEVQRYKEELASQEPKQVSAFEEMDLEIIGFEEPVSKNEDGTTNYQVSDVDTINLPPKKYIATLCIGQRFMTQDKEGRIVGIEVVNITDDYVSDPERPVRMINLRKV